MVKILLAYDYAINSSGSENFGIVEILRNFLVEKKVEFLVHKYQLSANPINLVVKFFKLLNFLIINKDIEVFIAYNPVNAFFGFICKIVLLRKYNLIFYSVDFTEKRFGIYIFDKIYVLLDKIASKVSNEVWSCSSRVFEYRKNFLRVKNNYYIPNVPTYKKNNLKKFKNVTIVMLSVFSDNYKFDQVLNLLNLIKERNIDMYIIGSGEGSIKDLIKDKIKELDIQDRVVLPGYLPHTQVLQILEQSHIGLALYNGKEDFNFWGDSMKIREYTYYGMPVITTKNVTNCAEVKENNLGVILEDFENLNDAVKFILLEENYKNFTREIETYNSKINPGLFFSKRLGI